MKTTKMRIYLTRTMGIIINRILINIIIRIIILQNKSFIYSFTFFFSTEVQELLNQDSASAGSDWLLHMTSQLMAARQTCIPSCPPHPSRYEVSWRCHGDGRRSAS